MQGGARYSKQLGGLGAGALSAESKSTEGASSPAGSFSGSGVPVIPEEYYGTLVINNVPAAAGTTITARINGVDKGTFTLTEHGVFGGPGTFDPKMMVVGDEYDEGELVTFWVNDLQAAQSDVFNSGTNTGIDLVVTGQVSENIWVSPDYAPGDSGGHNWGFDAFASIQDAVDAAMVPGTVFLAPGYYEQSFELENGVVVKGAGPDSIMYSGSGPVVSGYHVDDSAGLDSLVITGGGVLLDSSTPVISNCVFHDNHADYGAAIHNRSSSPLVLNCTFYGNQANSRGGAVYNENNSHPVVYNSIFWHNTPDQIGTETGSAATVMFSDVEGGYGEAGDYNINAEPGFVDVGSSDFHLLSCSPCVDSGSNDVASVILAEDYEGDGRVFDGNDDGTATVDMGADEALEAMLTCPDDLNCDNLVNGDDLARFARSFGRADSPDYDPVGDFSRDHDVDGLDLAAFIDAFEPAPCP